MITTSLRFTGSAPKLVDDFRYRIKPVYLGVGPEKLPTRMLAALNANVDDDKWLGQQFLGDDPSGKGRIRMMVEIHWVQPGSLVLKSGRPTR